MTPTTHAPAPDRVRANTWPRVSPPLPMFRRMGIRTRGEIDREKYALKALRGDFSGVRPLQADDDRSPRSS